MKSMKMCLNWKVAAGLAAVGLGVWVIAPGLLGAAAPLLLLAICPLSMLVMLPMMMRGMRDKGCATEPDGQGEPSATGRTRADRVAELRRELASVQARQEAIGQQLAQLDTAPPAAVREAEAVAQAADGRR